MAKILIVGANQTSLLLCQLLGKQGNEITVFERKKQEDVSYPWHDDMTPSAFSRVGIEPPKEIYTPNRDLTFISPNKKTKLVINLPTVGRDVSIWRRPLNDWLYEKAKEYATFYYSTKVNGAIVANGAVVGLDVEGLGKVYADLVVDCGGVNSVVRTNLPKEFNIPKSVNPNNVFVVKRCFFKRKDIQSDNLRMNLYLKHIGESGISWCVDHPENNTVDVLIGRVAKLDDEVYENALKDVKNDFEIVGDEIEFGAEKAVIPVQRAISRMVADGYVLLGDSAFMTIPMIGSGMATSMIGAKILSEVLEEKQDFSKENLYNYQVKFMKEVGANNCGIDLLKNWLLSVPGKDIDFLLGKQIIGVKELESIGGGGEIKLGFKDVLQKIKAGITRIPLLLKLVGAISKMEKQKKIAFKIPEKYDEEQLTVWQNKYDKLI